MEFWISEFDFTELFRVLVSDYILKDDCDSRCASIKFSSGFLLQRLVEVTKII